MYVFVQQNILHLLSKDTKSSGMSSTDTILR